MPYQALHRPCRRIAERADRMALDLVGNIKKHIDLALFGPSSGHALEHPPHPARSLPARGALAARLMLVEIGDARYRLDHVRRFVHDDDRCCTETRLQVAQAVEVERAIENL